jgi:hypothetical protein
MRPRCRTALRWCCYCRLLSWLHQGSIVDPVDGVISAARARWASTGDLAYLPINVLRACSPRGLTESPRPPSQPDARNANAQRPTHQRKVRVVDEGDEGPSKIQGGESLSEVVPSRSSPSPTLIHFSGSNVTRLRVRPPQTVRSGLNLGFSYHDVTHALMRALPGFLKANFVTLLQVGGVV